jgi:hypothetical protein
MMDEAGLAKIAIRRILAGEAWFPGVNMRS